MGSVSRVRKRNTRSAGDLHHRSVVEPGHTSHRPCLQCWWSLPNMISSRLWNSSRQNSLLVALPNSTNPLSNTVRTLTSIDDDQDSYFGSHESKSNREDNITIDFRLDSVNEDGNTSIDQPSRLLSCIIAPFWHTQRTTTLKVIDHPSLESSKHHDDSERLTGKTVTSEFVPVANRSDTEEATQSISSSPKLSHADSNNPKVLRKMGSSLIRYGTKIDLVYALKTIHVDRCTNDELMQELKNEGNRLCFENKYFIVVCRLSHIVFFVRCAFLLYWHANMLCSGNSENLGSSQHCSSH
jgi:hypothetical protein